MAERDSAKSGAELRRVRKPRKAGENLPGEKSAHMAAPRKLKLLIVVVDREKVDSYMDLLQSFDTNAQFAVAARGTASSDLLHVMGLEESAKSVILAVIPETSAKEALRELEKRFSTVKRGKGIAYTVPLSGIIGVSLYRFFCNQRSAQKEE